MPVTARTSHPHRPERGAMNITLTALGWDTDRAAYLRRYRTDHRPGRVARVDRGVCTVLTEDGPVRATSGGALLAAAAGDATRLPCAGDWVLLGTWPDARVTVEAVLPRRTALIRRTAGKDASGQLLAANLDAAAVVEPVHPAPDAGRIERLLSLVHESGARPLVVLTKTDLAADPAAVARQLAAARAGGAGAAGQCRAGQRAGPAARRGGPGPDPRPARALRRGQVEPGQRARRGDGDAHPVDPPGRRQGAAHHHLAVAGAAARRRCRAGHPGRAGGRPAGRRRRASTGPSSTSPISPPAAGTATAGTSRSRAARCGRHWSPASSPPAAGRAGAACTARSPTKPAVVPPAPPAPPASAPPTNPRPPPRPHLTPTPTPPPPRPHPRLRRSCSFGRRISRERGVMATETARSRGRGARGEGRGRGRGEAGGKGAGGWGDVRGGGVVGGRVYSCRGALSALAQPLGRPLRSAQKWTDLPSHLTREYTDRGRPSDHPWRTRAQPA